MIPEREREALMRLTMCAREECSMCKYQYDCNFDFQYELATENMNILAEALRKLNSSEKPNNCKKCKWWNESYGCHWKEGVCHYVPKAIIPKQCVSCDSASRIIEAYSQGFKDGADAVKPMPQTFTADGIVFAKMDEPQTGRFCDNCEYYGGGEVCDHPSIGEVEMGGKGDTFPWIKETPEWCPLKDEPQTDCPWK